MVRSICRFFFSAILASAVISCAAIPEPTTKGPDATSGYIALQQSLDLGGLAITPLRVVEDSRCPVQTTCIWAGRLIVETLVAGPGWQQTTDLILGEPQVVHSVSVTLSNAVPEASAEGEAKPADYRFAFEMAGQG